MNHPESQIPAQPYAIRPIRYEVDFQCPVQFTFTHRIEVASDLLELIRDFLNPSETPEMPTTQEIVDQIKALKDEFTSLATTEHGEVMAAIEGSKNTAGQVPQEVADALKDLGDSVKDSITKIVDAAGGTDTGGTVTPPPGDGTIPTVPTDGGTPPAPPSTGPNPEPSTTPPTPGGEGQPVPSTVAP